MKVYGPYTRKDGRKHVIVVNDGSRRTVSYPKYLMEQHLGRELRSDETVDHINRDFTDDRIENLQVLVKAEHSKIDHIHVKPVEIQCIWCGQVSKKRAAILRSNSKQGHAGPFCSRVCAGKYGAALQNGRIEKFGAQPTVVSEYYKITK
jgi:hypothetical protein